MKKNWIWIAGLAALAIGCSKGGDTATAPTDTSTATPTTGGSSTPAAAGSYAAVQTIFTQNCVGCHGANGGKGGIDLTNHDAVMKGGMDGAIVVAGDPGKSKLVDALRGRNGAMQMPKGKGPLPEDQIKQVEDWIKAGAKA